MEIINIPSIFSIARTLGLSVSDIGTLVSNLKLRTNKWSRYKPVNWPNELFIYFVNENWWKGEDGKCGLNIRTYNGPGSFNIVDSFLYNLKKGGIKWDYLAPTGGMESPFRFTDFKNYYHEAIMPIGEIGDEQYYLDVNGNITIQFELTVSDDNLYNLTLSDITIEGVKLSEYYLGVLLYNESESYALAGSVNKMGTGDLTINLKNMIGYLGKWKLALFTSSVIVDQNGQLQDGIYIPIEKQQYSIEIKKYGTLYEILPQGYWNMQNNVVSFDIYAKNDGSSAITINNVLIILLYTTGSQKPEEGEVVTQMNIGSIDIPASTTIAISNPDNYFSHIKVQGRTYWLAGRADNVTTVYNQIEDSSPE